jgi:hypothetical protein
MNAKFDPKVIQLSQRTLRDLPAGRPRGITVRTGERNWSLFADCYRRSADDLANTATREPWRHDLLGAPMLFLYRHYIELQLKALLLHAGELLDDPQTVPPRHYLKILWERVREMLLRVSKQRPDDPWFARADDIIGQFDEIDKTSFAFRYPVDTKGNPSLDQVLIVDAQNVRGIVDELAILLEGADGMIHEYQQIKYEMQSYDNY